MNDEYTEDGWISPVSDYLSDSEHMDEVAFNVATFMRGVGQDLPTSTVVRPDPALLDLRMALITEEFDETIAALVELKRPDLTTHRRVFLLSEILDGVCDLIYVAIGTALALGLPIGEAWAEVQRSNMQKLRGPKRDDGKQLKPADWTPPQIEKLVREFLAEHDFADLSISG